MSINLSKNSVKKSVKKSVKSLKKSVKYVAKQKIGKIWPKNLSKKFFKNDFTLFLWSQNDAKKPILTRDNCAKYCEKNRTKIAKELCRNFAKIF